MESEKKPGWDTGSERFETDLEAGKQRENIIKNTQDPQLDEEIQSAENIPTRKTFIRLVVSGLVLLMGVAIYVASDCRQRFRIWNDFKGVEETSDSAVYKLLHESYRGIVFQQMMMAASGASFLLGFTYGSITSCRKAVAHKNVATIVALRWPGSGRFVFGVSASFFGGICGILFLVDALLSLRLLIRLK
ncbi:hypothetical protein JCM33374_g1653 [Metschnikowia sp. JCM 33374]|nr:hypothetical protein JCM33374_g1653 [Metschnikowia sp. JCM 33374]